MKAMLADAHLVRVRCNTSYEMQKLIRDDELF